MNILFVSHTVNRSGAPLVLLELLRYLKRETGHQSTILGLRDGPSEAEFAQVAEMCSNPKPFVRASQIAAAKRRLHTLEGVPTARFEAILGAIERVNLRRARRVSRGFADKFDLVYLNSVASGDVLPALDPLLNRAPLITHVHELEWVIETLPEAFRAIQKRSDFWVAASDATRNHLIESRGIAPKKVETVREFVDFSRLQTDVTAARSALRARLNLPHNAFLVGGCGTMEWRKGADLWAKLASQTPNAHFVWLGGQPGAFSRGVEFDLKRLGAKNVHFLPPTSEPEQFFAALYAFALTSREDPLALVGIEAAAQGVPLLAFQNAGGLGEIVGNDAGFLAPYGDTWAMSRTLENWRVDEKLRLELGGNAARKVRELCDVNRNAPRVLALLESVARSR